MKPVFVLFAGLAFGLCPSLFAQTPAENKSQALEKKLSAEQKRLLEDFVDLRVRQEAHDFDPTQGTPRRTRAEIRAAILDGITFWPPLVAQGFWRDLPWRIKQDSRRLDPLYVSAEERKAAARLPAAAKEDVAGLLSDNLGVVFAARRKLLTYGDACRSLVADQAARLPLGSAKRLRHEDLLALLDREEAHERLVRITELALQKAATLEKKRGKTSTIAVLMARRICDVGDRESPYCHLCYCNFIRNNHDYSDGVALCFGNGQGNVLGINFHGGHDNRLCALAGPRYEDVKTAPGPETTAKWWRDRRGVDMTAVVDQVYLLHVKDKQDKVNFTVKFKVRDLSLDEWIIIEWERIPQEK